MLYSMEFHGSLVPPNEISLSSMEFDGILRLSFYSISCYPGLPWDIPWNSVELWSRQIKKSPSSMGFYGIRRAPFQMTQVFNEIQWNITWNSMELWCRQMKYHLVPWNSRKYSMEFHGTLVPPNEASLNSMEFHGTLRLSFYGMLPWTSKGYSMEFHGTLESTNKKSSSSMGFQGNRKAPFQMRQSVPWNIPWNSMELWSPPNEISLSSMEFHGIFHGIPWNFGAAKWSIT